MDFLLYLLFQRVHKRLEIATICKYLTLHGCKGIKSCRILQLFYTFFGATHLIYADTEVLSRRPEGKVVAIPPLLPSAISPQPSAILHQPSDIFHLPSYISPQPSYISHLTSAIIHHPSYISHPTSYILLTLN